MTTVIVGKGVIGGFPDYSKTGFKPNLKMRKWSFVTFLSSVLHQSFNNHIRVNIYFSYENAYHILMYTKKCILLSRKVTIK